MKQNLSLMDCRSHSSGHMDLHCPAIDGESEEVWAASLLALSTTQKSHLLLACLFVLSESQSELAFRHIFPIKLE